MSIDVRPVAGEDEHQAFLQVDAAAFGDAWRPPSPERRALDERLRDRGRELVAVDDGRVVAGCFAYDVRLTVPGGADLPVAGLAGVGVDPTRTGRGLLRRLMAAHLDDARNRGEAGSILLASESGLYRRFGYGWATSMAVYEATSRSAGLRQPVVDSGALELVADRASARGLAAEVYAELGRRVAGTVSRSDAWWDVVFGAEAGWLGGGPQLSVVHRDGDGRPDGYLLYTVKPGPADGHWTPEATVRVRELVGLDLTAQLALWDHCTRVPLTRRVRWEPAPVDTPIRWHLADPRQLRTVAAHDLLWLRVLDVAAVLQARRYDVEGRVSFQLVAPEDPLLAGAWTLDASGGGAVVRRGGDPAVVLGLPELGSAVLGGVGIGELAAAGQVLGEAGDVALLARLLATPTRPFCLSKF